jgi:aryl-alcohol dehydrogenase-like predicted oxidoreductase
MGQVALAWLHDRPAVSSVVLGARTTGQLRDNLGAVGLHLSEQETARLDAASDPAPAAYPYGAAGREQHTRSL